jgi:hypothetical protein
MRKGGTPLPWAKTLEPDDRLAETTRMDSVPKCRALWILGVLLVCAEAWVHSHADSWATFPYPPSIDPTGKAMYVDEPASHLYQDSGIAMMILGGIAFTLGLAAWIYPPRQA